MSNQNRASAGDPPQVGNAYPGSDSKTGFERIETFAHATDANFGRGARVCCACAYGRCGGCLSVAERDDSIFPFGSRAGQNRRSGRSV
jgi:hypothetical protein